LHTREKFQVSKRRVGKGENYMNYPVGDFLIQLKNAALARNQEVTVSNTKLIRAVADEMKRLGYLDKVEEKKGKLTAKLAFHKKEPLMNKVRLVSKPGLRIYVGADDLEKERGPSVFIISTPKGVMSSRKAIKERLGGEVIAEVL
jgi:small subunit ribosomal protein S8